ncbi:MAG: hypothetical protein WC222_11295 [Parachlamydiales bacterium]|jgi:hypothetical protein
METFISLSERINMPYIEYGDAQIKIKVVNLKEVVQKELDKRQKEDMTNIVEIRPIKIDKYKETRVSLSFSRDERTGIYYGIPIGTHLDGNIKWRKVILTDRNVFNLNHPLEAQMWYVARFNPFVEGSPFHGMEPVFRVYDPEMEAKKDIVKATALGLAITRVKTMRTAELIGFARYLALPIPEEVSDKLVRAEIMRFVMMNPVEFNHKFDDENRQIAEIFYSANSLGLVIFDIEHGYSYKGTFLGSNELDSIRFLMKDTLTLTSISSVLKQTDTDAEKLKSKEQNDEDDLSDKVKPKK